MQSMVSSLELKNSVQIYPVLARRSEATRQALFYLLQGPKKDLPMLDVWQRALGMLFVATYGPQAADPGFELKGIHKTNIVDICINSARSYTNLAEYVADLNRTQRAKIVQMVMDRESIAAGFAEAAGLRDQPAISGAGLVDIFLQGQGAGPRGSQVDAVRHAARWASIPDTVRSGKTAEDYVKIALLIRLQESLIHIYRNPPAPAANDMMSLSPEGMVMSLLKTLRSVAATFASMALAGAVVGLRHLVAVASHPWFESLLDTSTYLKMRDYVDVVAKRDYQVSAWPTWPELSNKDVWDASLLNPLEMIGGSVKAGSVPARELEPTVATGFAFARELMGGTQLNSDAATLLLSSIGTQLSYCDRLKIIVDGALGEGADVQVYGGTSIDLEPVSRAQAREPRAIADLSGYPILTSHDVWNAAPKSDFGAALMLNADRQRYYTTAWLDKNTKEKSGGWQPVFIHAKRTLQAGSSYPDIVPVFKNWTDDGMYLSPSLFHLARLWNSTPAELARTVAALPFDANSPLLRAMADSLRMVGFLFLAPKVPDLGTFAIVHPSCQHWYHSSGEAFRLLLAGLHASKTYTEHLGVAPPTPNVTETKSAASLLSEYTFLDDPAKAIMTLGTLAKGQVMLGFYPFRAALSTCQISSSMQVIREMDFFRTGPGGALARWISSATPTGMWDIAGWSAVPRGELGDIVGAPMSVSIDQYFELIGDSDKVPTYLQRTNSIVSLFGPADTQLIVPTQIAGIVEADEPIF